MPGYTEAVIREVPWTEGDVVRKLRVITGWTLEELAGRAGVSLTMIHELEMGKTKEAKRSKLTQIAAAFGLTYRGLVDQVPPKPVTIDDDIWDESVSKSPIISVRPTRSAPQRNGHALADQSLAPHAEVDPVPSAARQKVRRKFTDLERLTREAEQARGVDEPAKAAGTVGEHAPAPRPPAADRRSPSGKRRR